MQVSACISKAVCPNLAVFYWIWLVMAEKKEGGREKEINVEPQTTCDKLPLSTKWSLSVYIWKCPSCVNNTRCGACVHIYACVFAKYGAHCSSSVKKKLKKQKI